MIEINRENEPLQEQVLFVDQAEQDLMRASVVLEPYGDFDQAPEPIVGVFVDACDTWLWAQVRAMNGGLHE